MTATVPYETGLHRLATDVWAWLAPSGTWGYSNAGLIVGDTTSALVDTLYDYRLTHRMLEAMSTVTATRPVVDAVNTHGNGDHCYGNALLAPDVRIHATPGAVQDLREEDPADLAALLRTDLPPVLDAFARRCFGDFAFEEVEVREPDTLIEGDALLRVDDRPVRLLPLGPAHTLGDTVVHVVDAGVVFAGDLLFVEGTPIMWAGPVENWLDACDALTALDADVVVPGHGPVTDGAGIAEVRAYLDHVHQRTLEAFAAGQDWRQAADEIDLDRFARLPDAERVVATVHTIYRSLDAAVPAVGPMEIFSRMAAWRATRGQESVS